MAIENDRFIKIREIADKTNLSQSAVEKIIAKLKLAGIIQRIGPDKGGHWEVLENGE